MGIMAFITGGAGGKKKLRVEEMIEAHLSASIMSNFDCEVLNDEQRVRMFIMLTKHMQDKYGAKKFADMTKEMFEKGLKVDFSGDPASGKPEAVGLEAAYDPKSLAEAMEKMEATPPTPTSTTEPAVPTVDPDIVRFDENMKKLIELNKKKRLKSEGGELIQDTLNLINKYTGKAGFLNQIKDQLKDKSPDDQVEIVRDFVKHIGV